MQIRVGYELVYECQQPTPMILTLNVHFTRVSDVLIADHIITSPPTRISAYATASETCAAGSSPRRVTPESPLTRS